MRTRGQAVDQSLMNYASREMPSPGPLINDLLIVSRYREMACRKIESGAL